MANLANLFSDLYQDGPGVLTDRSVSLAKLPGNTITIKAGFDVSHDYLGREISGVPDIGALEIE